MVALFERKAPGVMALLMADFPLLGVDGAAAILGNFGEESGGFEQLQEQKPIGGGQGGWGWAQETGPRRKSMFDYCARNKLDPSSDIANYKWVFIELSGPYRRAVQAVASAPTLEKKVAAFMNTFEMPNAAYAHLDSRIAYAKRALAAYAAAKPTVAATMFDAAGALVTGTGPAAPTTTPAPVPTTTQAPTKGRSMPTPSATPAAPASASGPGISLDTIKRTLDNLDDEIDALRDFPFIGKLASSVALLLDPVRKAVDSGVLSAVRTSVDQIDAEISRLSALPFLGGFIASIATVTHKIRVYVDAADPASLVAAPPA